MTVLTETTKAQRMRDALSTLAGEYISRGKHKLAMKVTEAADLLDSHPESLASLYNILQQTTTE